MIRLEHITKTYVNAGKKFNAADDVSLEIKKGEIFGIIGFSGAGKSTLVRCINLLERPDSGKVFINDKDITALRGAELRRQRKKIGMIFQHFNLFASRTVLQNVIFPIRYNGLSAAERRKKALELLEGSEYDLVLLDVSLNEGNGFSLCSAIKKERQLPVIFLTASGDEFSVVTGLDLGADDYIAKPFRPRELVSRINSVLRRCGKSQKLFDIDDIRVDLDKGVVYKNGQDLYLSALEYRLLLAFINSEGRLLTRSRLLEEIWDVAGDFVNDNTLTVYIKRLRDKIEDNPAQPKIIVTVRGMGYKLGK